MPHIKTHLRNKYAQIIRTHLVGEGNKNNTRGNTENNSKPTSSAIAIASQLQQLINQLRKSQAIQTPLIGTYIADETREISPPIISGLQYAYPRFAKKSKGQPTPLLQFKVVSTPLELQQKVYGIKVPPSHLKTVFPEVVLVPLHCFHPLSKHRLGYGGGYYDRYISQSRQSDRKSMFIGIGTGCVLTNEEFWTASDQPLDYVVTQTQIY